MTSSAFLNIKKKSKPKPSMSASLASEGWLIADFPRGIVFCICPQNYAIILEKKDFY